MGNNSTLFYKQTLKEICAKYVMSSFPTHNYLLNKSKHAVPIESPATVTVNIVEPTYVCKKNNINFRFIK